MGRQACQECRENSYGADPGGSSLLAAGPHPGALANSDKPHGFLEEIRPRLLERLIVLSRGQAREPWALAHFER